jgi:hypothetical protein
LIFFQNQLQLTFESHSKKFCIFFLSKYLLEVGVHISEFKLDNHSISEDVNILEEEIELNFATKVHPPPSVV